MGTLTLGAMTLCLGLFSFGVEERGSSTSQCKIYLERNKTCEDAMLSRCESEAKAIMLQKMEQYPPAAKKAWLKEIDDQIGEYCGTLIEQAVGEKALSTCLNMMNSSDREQKEEMERMRKCLMKASCGDYAKCSLKVR